MSKLFAFHLHGNDNPWFDAPPWALELGLMGQHTIKQNSLILREEEAIMPAVDDLNNAVSALAKGFTDLDTAVHTELKALTDALAADNSLAVQQAAANISSITSRMAGDAAELTASIPAATTVPAPVPPPAPPVEPTVTPPALADVPVSAPDATPPTT